MDMQEVKRLVQWLKEDTGEAIEKSLLDLCGLSVTIEETANFLTRLTEDHELTNDDINTATTLIDDLWEHNDHITSIDGPDEALSRLMENTERLAKEING